MGDTQLLVLNGERQLAGIGEFGELYVRSPHLARGYLNDTTLTAEKFLRNPFTNDPEDRLYKTGDMGRYRPDGTVEFACRNDHQIKIRGFRIELGEIETRLAQHLAVKDSVVLARQDTAADLHLVGYVVSAGDSNLSTQDLRTFLQQKLPDHMLPSAFVFLDSLPLTPNGKLDRNALPPPDKTRPELQSGYCPPATREEKLVGQIWCDLLKLDEAGIHDNFFDLGGHSLLATQLISRIRDIFKVDLPLRSLFELPTISGLAQRLSELGKKQNTPAEAQIVPIGRENYRLKKAK